MTVQITEAMLQAAYRATGCPVDEHSPGPRNREFFTQIYEAMRSASDDETAHLLSSPANAERLRRAIEQLDASDSDTRPKAGDAKQGSTREVEITQEMLDAGADALCLWDEGERPELVCWSVFQAMMKVAQSSANPSDTPPYAVPPKRLR